MGVLIPNSSVGPTNQSSRQLHAFHRHRMRLAMPLAPQSLQPVMCQAALSLLAETSHLELRAL